MGIFLGLVPGLLMKCIIFFLIMILRVNIGTAFMASAVFAVIGLTLDPLSDKIGFFILNLGLLVPLWTALFNMAIVPFTRFNNTVVMGNIAIAAILFVPAFFAFKKLVMYYREHWREKVSKWKIIKLLTAGNLSYKILK